MVDLLNGLKHYWKFDEESGTLFVDSVGDVDGTASNERVSGETGKLSNGADFTKGDDSIALTGFRGAFGSIKAEHTIGFWFKTTSTTELTEFIGGTGTGGGVFIYDVYLNFTFDASTAVGNIGIQIGRSETEEEDGRLAYNTKGGNFNDGEWHHVVIVVDTDQPTTERVKFYIDGVLWTDTHTEHDVSIINYSGSSEDLHIGARNRGSSVDRHIDALMDEFFWYDRPINSDEVAAIYNNGDGLTLEGFGSADPTVTTQAVTDIDKTTATANGNVTDLGDEASVEAGHQFRIKNEATPNAWTNTATQSLSATGAYTTSLTGLDPDTTYEVRSRVTWDAGAEEAFGSIEEFTTDPLDAPTVTTQAATSVGSGGATLNGNVTSKGDFDPVDARFQYRETGSGTWLETSLSEDVATGAYTFGLTGLTPETTYEFRAKVEYDTDQEVFGDTLTFTTLEGTTAPSVTTNAMTEIRATYATANGDVTSDGGETVTERGFVWATTTAPDVTDNKVEVAGTTGVYSVKLTTLPPETLIYVRTYAINSEGTSYGNEVEFTTLSLEDVRNPVYIKDGDNLRRI